MRNAGLWSIGSLAASLLVVGACHNRPAPRHEHHGDRDRDVDEHSEERRDPELGSGLSTGAAVRAIASARCDREQRCENVGADKKYLSESACREQVTNDWAVDLNKYECPRGIVQAELDECLRDVRAEDCGNPFDTLSRVVACNAADICDDGD